MTKESTQIEWERKEEEKVVHDENFFHICKILFPVNITFDDEYM